MIKRRNTALRSLDENEIQQELKIEETVNEIIDEVKSPFVPVPKKEYDMTKTISTGSTLLDLCISGKTSLKGGIPGGIVLEIYGPAASGKTAILVKLAASTQMQGGSVKFQDPEARLNKEYSRIYGMELNEKDYSRPKTVSEIFANIKKWNPKNPNVINTICTDSLAALSTNLELEKGDKMGQRRAKEFSEGFRTTAISITDNNWIMANSNQVRDGEWGETTPGGQALKYYASLRIRIAEIKKIDKEISLDFLSKKKDDEKGEEEKKSTKKFKKIIGIESACYVRKSSVDDPYRQCNITILFNYGIDKTRDNLQYIKDMTSNTVYECPDGKSYLAIDKAINWTEDNNLEEKLEDNVIEIWNLIEDKFRIKRKLNIKI